MAQDNGKILVLADPELEDLIPEFLEDRQEDIKTISKSLEDGDMETVRILGHSMKGSGGGYGFDKITEIGSHIEEAAIKSNKDAVEDRIKELASYLGRVEVKYE